MASFRYGTEQKRVEGKKEVGGWKKYPEILPCVLSSKRSKQ
jgi:hypothetical protein